MTAQGVTVDNAVIEGTPLTSFCEHSFPTSSWLHPDILK